MTSKEVYQYLTTNTVKQLYDKYVNNFNMIDKWEETFIKGDLLNEYELSLAIDQATGCFGKFCHVVNALESYFERTLNNAESKHYQSLPGVKSQDTSVAKAFARDTVSDVRDYLGDFKAYLNSAQQIITSAQSRIKRLAIESGGRGVSFRGEAANAAQAQHPQEAQPEGTGNAPISTPPATSNQTGYNPEPKNSVRLEKPTPPPPDKKDVSW